MIKMITSITNPRVKQIVSLRNARKRRQLNLSIAEGEKEVEKLLESAFEVEEIYFPSQKEKQVASFLKKCKKKNVALYGVKAEVFSKMAFGGREELLAVFKVQYPSLDNFLLRKNPLYLVIEGVEKPGNLGAILRTCDGAGIDEIMICDGGTDIFNPNVIRASIGTVFHKNIVSCTSVEASEFLKQRQIKIIAASPQAECVYTKANLKGGCALVVGSEQGGLTPYWFKRADQLVRIPMQGGADSLNVSTSTAVLLYEALRQRTK